MNIDDIRDANKRAGLFFFEYETMRFFDCRVHSRVYRGGFFVTSEKGPDGWRRFTVRQAGEDGSIRTIGEFQQYGTREAAHDAAKTFSLLAISGRVVLDTFSTTTTTNHQ